MNKTEEEIGLHVGTITGRCVSIEDPQADQIELTDIICGLSHVTRFSGQTKKFYSVGEHSARVYFITQQLCREAQIDFSPALQLQALFHDASEAYFTDIPKPLKNLLPGYELLEDNLMRVIAAKFGFAWPMDSLVHAADQLACHEEMKVLRYPGLDYHYLEELEQLGYQSVLESLNMGVHCYDPKSTRLLLWQLALSLIPNTYEDYFEAFNRTELEYFS